ncbi:Electron transfer flavoprotein subunit beta [Candidatus Bealeia paramacronuclearis]|uniref:Electron transfer flavoprotein subunit beta n=1 Tax=Candidatus Bealeia paramacronuclearis TaxID=1921001 RepID=A0ABZ2C5I2_9PROT|nr:Electron transfer flavoprotein subunit beta [Candidatus Bealeia paramacronuclearis]
MKILVPIKRVIDYNVKIRVKSDESGIELSGVKMSINPFDEIAIEEAVRLKEQGKASEVVLVSLGEKSSQETLRAGLALGADRAIHIESTSILEPIHVAHALKIIVAQENPNLVLLGKQAIDDDCNQTGQMLSALLGWSQATFASKIAIEGNHAAVTREVDGGLETLKLSLPCVITTDLRLNEPRFATLPNIMKAKQKTMSIIAISDLNIDLAPHLKTLKTQEPGKRHGGIKVTNVDELLSKLQNEAKVI